MCSSFPPRSVTFHKLCYWKPAKPLAVISTCSLGVSCLFPFLPSGNSAACLSHPLRTSVCYLSFRIQFQRPIVQGDFLRSSLLERTSPFFELPEGHIWLLYPTLYYSYVCHITEMRFNTLELNFHSVSYIMCSGWVKGQHELIFLFVCLMFFYLRTWKQGTRCDSKTEKVWRQGFFLAQCFHLLTAPCLR